MRWPTYVVLVLAPWQTKAPFVLKARGNHPSGKGCPSTMKQWFVAEASRKGLSIPLRDRGKIDAQISASLYAASLGFETFVPLRPHFRRIGGHLIETQASRYGAYIFVRFDRDSDPWGELSREPPHRTRYFSHLLCDNNIPTPVPERAMEAIRAYEPEPIVPALPIVYKTGQPVVVTKAGVRLVGVFVGYQGNRPKVDIWIFGRVTTTDCSNAELEPLDIDTEAA